MAEKTKGDKGAWNPISRRESLILVMGVMCWAVFFIVFFLIIMLFGGCSKLAGKGRSGAGRHGVAERPCQCTSEAWSLDGRGSKANLLVGESPAVIPTRTKGGTDV